MTSLLNKEDIAKASEVFEAAIQTRCGFAECDGTGHEPFEAAESWSHQLIRYESDLGVAELVTREGSTQGYVQLEFDAAGNADAMREIARNLRRLADNVNFIATRIESDHH